MRENTLAAEIFASNQGLVRDVLPLSSQECDISELKIVSKNGKVPVTSEMMQAIRDAKVGRIGRLRLFAGEPAYDGRIGTDGAKLVAAALRETSLVHLSMAPNNIGNPVHGTFCKCSTRTRR